jgi:hypothetical protein
MKQTQFEIDFVSRVREFTSQTGITAATICRKFGYWNSQKINAFLNGDGVITSKTMGQIMFFINEYENEFGIDSKQRPKCPIAKKNPMRAKHKIQTLINENLNAFDSDLRTLKTDEQ